MELDPSLCLCVLGAEKPIQERTSMAKLMAATVVADETGPRAKR